MAAQDKVTFKQDLTEPVKIRHYEGVVFTGDDCGNLIKVALFDGGVPYSGGGTVSATAILADGTTFPLTHGSITDNMVSVPLEAGALAVSGLMGLYVKISGGGIICTVLNAIFTVQATDTGMVPAAMVTTVNELVAAIRDAQDSITADLTNLLAAVAPTFSTSTAYSAGAYVWQGGKLYRFTAAHPAGTWTGTDAVAVAIVDDFADFKNDLVLVQSEQPTSWLNRIWIQPQSEEYQVPTWEEYEDLKSAIQQLVVESDLSGQYTERAYIRLAVGLGNVVDIDNPESSTIRNYIVVPCKAGDWFAVSGTGGANPRLWGVLDSNKKLVAVANQESVESDTVVTIAQDGYFVSNVYRNADYSLYYYSFDIIQRVSDVQAELEDIQNIKIENIIEVANHYYLASTGSLQYTSNNFSATNMIKVSPGDHVKVTTSMGDNVGVAGYDISRNHISRIADTNGGIYIVQRGVTTTDITIPENVEYITVSNVAPNETSIVVYTNNMRGNEENTLPNVLIVPENANRFLVYVIAENGSYFIHRFVRQYYSDVLSYGDGQTKTVVGADIWYSDLITNNGINIMAGNFNFIHNISNMAGHNGYVGAGHGCTVADWTIFEADGSVFDPTVLSKMITCAEFDFIIKAQNYLIDKANSPSESHAVPTLDGDGNPIVTSTNTINARIKANNDIEYRNRLIIKMDGIQFRECHGSMCEGYFSAFDNVIISNTEESWNYLDPANDYTREKMHGTQWDIFTVGSKKALSVVMFGDKYKVENKLIQLDGSRNKITNTRSEIYRTGGARMKIYLMPVVCTISAENISSGATIETFNTGDVIDCVSYRKISVSD